MFDMFDCYFMLLILMFYKVCNLFCICYFVFDDWFICLSFVFVFFCEGIWRVVIGIIIGMGCRKRCWICCVCDGWFGVCRCNVDRGFLLKDSEIFEECLLGGFSIFYYRFWLFMNGKLRKIIFNRLIYNGKVKMGFIYILLRSILRLWFFFWVNWFRINFNEIFLFLK